MEKLTNSELRSYADINDSDEEFLQVCVNTAFELVTKYVGQATVPESVLHAAQLEVALKIYMRRSAPNGAFNDGTGAAVFAPREVMITAYPLLDPFLPLGFA